MEQRRNLTPKEHWELHQGLWYMLGCDMQLKYKDRTTAVYVDNKEKLKYTYSTKGFIKWFPIPKEDKDANKKRLKRNLEKILGYTSMEMRC